LVAVVLGLLLVIIMVRPGLVLYLTVLLQQAVVMELKGYPVPAQVALAEVLVAASIHPALVIHHPQLHHKVIPAAHPHITTLVVAVVLVVAVEMPLHRLGELAVLALTRVRPLEHLMV